MRVRFTAFLSLFFLPTIVFAATMPFKDVPSDSYYYQPVFTALDQEVITSGTYFYPGKALTRAEFIDWMVKTIDAEPVFPDVPSFKDVQKTHFAYTAIETGKKFGLVSGTQTADFKPTGNFEPGKLVNRAEAAVIIMKAFMQVEAKTGVTFPDLKQVPWAVDAIKRAATAGFFKGYPDKTFGPANNILRAEGITVFMQVQAKLASEELTLSFAQNAAAFIKTYTKEDLLAKIEEQLPGFTAVNIRQTGAHVVFFAYDNESADPVFAWYRLPLTVSEAVASQLYAGKSFLTIARGAISPNEKEFFYTAENGALGSVIIATEAKSQHGQFTYGANKAPLFIAPAYTPDGKYIMLLNQADSSIIFIDAQTKNTKPVATVEGFWLNEAGGAGLESGEEYSQYTFLAENRVRFSNGAIIDLTTMTKEE